MKVSSRTSPKTWKRIAGRIRRSGYTAHDYAELLKKHLETGWANGARENAERVFNSLREDLTALHFALFGKYLKIGWVDTINNDNLGEVEKLLWDVGRDLQDVARRIFHNIETGWVYELPELARDGYYALRDGVERLYTLLTGKDVETLYQ